MMNAKTKAAVIRHGEQLLAIFPNATERDPVKLCSKLRKLEREGEALGLRLCNGPQFPNEDDADKISEAILAKVNALLGNRHEYQPKTGAKCGCKRGVQRDNCPNCEGTGFVVDFRAIWNRKPLVPIFVNRDPRGYALKIDSEWMAEARGRDEFYDTPTRQLHRDMGGYGILAPDLTEGN
jgi:hypothetical protein